MPQSLLSVIVLATGNATELNRCFDSILKQSYKNVEIILALPEESNTDGDAVTALQKKSAAIRIVSGKPGDTPAKVIHEAVAAANGTFLNLLNGTEFYCNKNKLKHEVRLIRKYNAEGIEVAAYSNMAHCYENGKQIDIIGIRKKEFRPDDFSSSEILSARLPRDLLFTKAQYEKTGGLDTALPDYERVDFFIRLAAHYLFVCTDRTGVAIQHDKNDLFAARTAEQLKWQRYIFEKQFVISEPHFEIKQARTCQFLNDLKLQYITAILASENGDNNKSVITNEAEVVDTLYAILTEQDKKNKAGYAKMLNRFFDTRLQELMAHQDFVFSDIVWKIGQAAGEMVNRIKKK